MEKARLKYEQELLIAREETKKERREAEKARREAAEKTRQEAEKARQEAEIRSKQRTNTVLKLYHLKSWTVEQIAEMMELEVDVVKTLIQNNQLT
jgi:DNA-directed RNA polymerase specialized sigma24 family protein